MRDFVNAILSVIGASSLTDDEFAALGVSTPEYSQAVYDAVLAVLVGREAVSTTRERLTAYFVARGVSVSEPSAEDTAQSNILLGADLGSNISPGFLPMAEGPAGPPGPQGEVGPTGPAGTTEFAGLEGDPSDNLALAGALDAKISNGATGKDLADLKVGDVVGGDYSEFEADGTLKMNGAATVWDDLLPSSVSVGASGVNVPSFTAYNGGLKAYEFVGSGVNIKEINLGFQLPHSYKEGTSITPHLHIRVPNDGTGGVIKFGCEYTWVNRNGASASPVTIYGTLTIGANAGDLGNEMVSFGAITGTGKTISSVFMARIFRDPADGADTFGSSVWLKSADIHIEKDTIGSRLIGAK